MDEYSQKQLKENLIKAKDLDFSSESKENDIIRTDSKNWCDGCISCCDGTLEHVFTHSKSGKQLVSPGQQRCSYLGKNGCLTYDDRAEPCWTFHCVYILDNNMPKWINPSVCGFVTMGPHELDKKDRWRVIQSKTYDLDIRALLWIIKWANRTNRNLVVKLLNDDEHVYWNNENSRAR